MKAILTLVMVSLAVIASSAAAGKPVSVAERAKGAERVVVGTIADVQASFEVNAFGDQLIVSHIVLDVEDTLRGASAAALLVAVEGGTVGDVTLRVSDMPSVSKGERAVFFLAQTSAGTFVPHGRGLGILKLDARNRVQDDSTLTLSDVARTVRASAR